MPPMWAVIPMFPPAGEKNLLYTALAVSPPAKNKSATVIAISLCRKETLTYDILKIISLTDDSQEMPSLKTNSNTNNNQKKKLSISVLLGA